MTLGATPPLGWDPAKDAATAFLFKAAEVSAEDLLAAARVLDAVAAVDIEPLWSKVRADSNGNPIPSTPEEREVWATWSAANEMQERAFGWARDLERGARTHKTEEAATA
ncbi:MULTISPECIES: hypothetical protein [unclassified Leucobacter]|uniref:hypothetical protein n=1 Tax=unclassified Leucobacter TaxID=2621730 RepID=UPI0030180281